MNQFFISIAVWSVDESYDDDDVFLFIIDVNQIEGSLCESFLPDLARTTTTKIDTKFDTTSENCLHIGENQDVKSEPIECGMTIVVHVVRFIRSDAVTNAEDPNISEEEPDEEKDFDRPLHSTRKGDGE